MGSFGIPLPWREGLGQGGENQRCPAACRGELYSTGVTRFRRTCVASLPLLLRLTSQLFPLPGVVRQDTSDRAQDSTGWRRCPRWQMYCVVCSGLSSNGRRRHVWRCAAFLAAASSESVLNAMSPPRWVVVEAHAFCPPLSSLLPVEDAALRD